jgi:hypothetical protein
MNRSAPVGGAPNGIPRYSQVATTRFPTSAPWVTVALHIALESVAGYDAGPPSFSLDAPEPAELPQAAPNRMARTPNGAPSRIADDATSLCCAMGFSRADHTPDVIH